MKVWGSDCRPVWDVAYHYYATEVLVLPEALASAEQRERNAQLMVP